jgi:thiamine-monophosphate kinase
VLVSELGEFGLIELLARELDATYPPSPRARPTPGFIVPLGDDALVRSRRVGALVWTTDTLVAGVHFLPDKTDWASTGWKALAVNLSDIAAMGAAPDLALVTLMLPEDASVDDVLSLYRGLKECAAAFGVTVGGGDIVRAPTFGITVALAGWADESRSGSARVMVRSAARKGDVVAVSGTLGNSAGGLRLLHGNGRLESEAGQELRAAHERPQPRVALGRDAVRAGVRCAIDVSDGLVQDLSHVARASGAGIHIDFGRVPVSEALRSCFASDAAALALSGGEDYELVLIAPKPVVQAVIQSSLTAVTAIGEVTDNDEPRVSVTDEAGRQISVPAGGWDHFRN